MLHNCIALAFDLNKTPHEIRQMPLQDFQDCMEFMKLRQAHGTRQ